jgi:uncharacterized protein YjiK
MSRKIALLILFLVGIAAMAGMAAWGYYAPTCYMKAHSGLPEVCSSRSDTIRLHSKPPILGIYADVFANIAWSPDGNSLFMLHTGTPPIKVWDIEGDIMKEYPLDHFGGSQQPLAFLNNDEIVLTFRAYPAAQKFSGLLLWNTKTGTLDKSIPSQYP